MKATSLVCLLLVTLVFTTTNAALPEKERCKGQAEKAEGCLHRLYNYSCSEMPPQDEHFWTEAILSDFKNLNYSPQDCSELKSNCGFSEQVAKRLSHGYTIAKCRNSYIHLITFYKKAKFCKLEAKCMKNQLLKYKEKNPNVFVLLSNLHTNCQMELSKRSHMSNVINDIKQDEDEDLYLKEY